MGIASFVVGLLVLMLSPFLNILLILPAILGVLLGIIDALIKSRRKESKGFAVAGIILSSIGLVVCVLITLTKYFIYDTISFPSNNKTINGKTSIIASEGEPTTVDELIVTLTSVDYDFKDYYSYAYIDDDCVILKADFKFENVGKYNEYVSYSDFECFADKFECDDFYSVEDAFFYATIEPGDTATGSVYFEVPEGKENIQIEFCLTLYGDYSIIFEPVFD